MEDRTFQQLMEATREALAHYKGEKRDLRTTELPQAPRPMSRKEVRRLRDKVKVSQSLFAKSLNVSTKLVQSWEGGTRHPEGAALRLLRVAEQAPGLVFKPSRQDSKPVDRRAVTGSSPRARRRSKR